MWVFIGSDNLLFWPAIMFHIFCCSSDPEDDNMEMDMTCSICLENMVLRSRHENHSRVALLVRCGHFYHEICTRNWIRGKTNWQRSCPTCRTEVKYDMEIEVITADVLIKNLKTILCLRQRHAQRQKQRERLEQRRGRGQRSDEDEIGQACNDEWVHVSLHHMEQSPPIALQYSHDTENRDREIERPSSPFTIITPEEIPPRSDTGSNATRVNDSYLRRNLYSRLDLPSFNSYENWMLMTMR